MGDFVIREAVPEDEKHLRELLRNTPMTGDIHLAMLRDPDFYESLQVVGEKVNVGVAENIADGKICAMVFRSEKTVYINEKPTKIGYLGGFRILPSSKSLGIIRQGNQLVKKWHSRGEAKLYLQTITIGNSRAESLLTSERLGFPRQHHYGKMYTYLMRGEVLTQIIGRPKGAFRRLLPGDVQSLNAFLQMGRSKQFFPVYREGDFLNKSGILRGLEMGDVFMFYLQNKPAGSIALWDQSDFKQDVVLKYSPRLSCLRNAINLWHRIKKVPGFPPKGQRFDHLCLSLICVRDNDPAVFSEMLYHLGKYFSRKNYFPSISIMLHEKDSLSDSLNRLPSFRYESKLMVSHFEDGKNDFDKLENKVPFMELGAF